MINLTSKQRAYLKGLAMNIKPVVQVGKSGLTSEIVESVYEAFNTREIIKIDILRNCEDDIRQIAEVIAERTHSTVVQIIGKKIVLYKEGKDNNKKIELPKAKVSKEV